MVSERREVADNRAVFQRQKEKLGKPTAILPDASPWYDRAFQKEYYKKKNPRTMNVRSISVRNEGLNSKVERLNGSVRDREIVMRGMDHKESAQILMDAMRIYHNYVRKHQALDGRTPAEASGIKLDLEGNPIAKLIRAAKLAEEG